jgi:hypothetical protein
MGVVTYATPRSGRRTRAATPEHTADSFLAWPRGAMTFTAVLVPIGAVLFAVAMWRSHAVPSWAAGLFAFFTVLIAAPVPRHAVGWGTACSGWLQGCG